MSTLNKKTINFVKIAIGMGQNYYPEIMHEMYIINCPLLFRGAYGMFKPFINEKTRKKIHILGGTITEMFTKIPKENVPAILGGSCNCEGGCCYSDAGPWKGHTGDRWATEQFLKL